MLSFSVVHSIFHSSISFSLALYRKIPNTHLFIIVVKSPYKTESMSNYLLKYHTVFCSFMNACTGSEVLTDLALYIANPQPMAFKDNFSDSSVRKMTYTTEHAKPTEVD